MLYVILFILSWSLIASTPNPQLERLNFFPRSRSFLALDYDYKVAKIKAKEVDSDVKAIREYTNSLNAVFGQRLSPSYIVGLNLIYENTTESDLRYGVDNVRRHSSEGLVNPGIFSLIRIFDQNDRHGILDGNLLFRPYTDERKIGGDGSNRDLGRNIFSATLSHGLKEEEWEFRTSFNFSFFSQGNEKDLGTGQVNDLSSYTTYQFMFHPQYSFNAKTHVWGGIGFIYSGIEEIESKAEGKREIQLGTASVFQGGVKYLWRKDVLFQTNYSITNGDYFVRSFAGNNFDGDRKIQAFTLGLIRSFN